VQVPQDFDVSQSLAAPGDQPSVRTLKQNRDSDAGLQPASADILPVVGAEVLFDPPSLHTAAMVLGRRSPVPPDGGVYAWYFDVIPPGVPGGGCRVVDGRTLLYVGISPKAPPANGVRPSRQSLRSRIRYHYRGNAEGSTLRLSLGSLLAEELGLVLRRVGSGSRMTFCHDGEQRLSGWMADHAWVAWAVVSSPWRIEELLIRELSLPLNLDQNQHSPFHDALTELRSRQRQRARQLSIVTS
jgi:hypothetical protein